jgi:peptidoglycan/LPS O-acetylase OafA/YrhL
MQESGVQRSNHLDPFLAMRGLACFVVLLYHVNPPRNLLVYQNYDLSWIIFGHGHVAVLIFFCLSGYLMGKAFYSERYTLNRAGIFNFFRNRVLRIFPLYYFSILILAIFVYPESLQIQSWVHLLRLCTFTYNQSIPVEFSGSFWSLSTEVQFYLIVPFIYAFFRNRLKKRIDVIFSFVGIIVLVLLLRFALTLIFDTPNHYHNYLRYIYTPLITNLDVFIGGFLVNAWLTCGQVRETELTNKTERKLFRFKRLRKYFPVFAILLVIALYLFTSYYYYHGGPAESLVYPLATMIIISLFIGLMESYDSAKSPRKNERLTWNAIKRNPIRVLEVFGVLSYGIYVWHQAILEELTTIITSTNPVEIFLIELVATLLLSSLLAAVTYYTVELPAARWKHYRSPTPTDHSTLESVKHSPSR